jgi:NAD(P)-dependent dehydrogenase (short-subunit alcohol dehydrogenase family)
MSDPNLAGPLLDGRRVVVTGGSRGLGAAIGQAFVAAGARVAVLDLPASLQAPGNWTGSGAFSCDVADERSVEAALLQAAALLGGLDGVVANAGLVPPWRETEGLDLDEWDSVFAVNVRGIAATLKHATPHLKRAGGGSVVLMASINGVVSHPRQMLYTATKHAVVGILKAAALDLGPHGIRVNALAPGPIATDALLSRIDLRATTGGPTREDALDALAAQTPLGRIAIAEEVAKAAVFLASGLSSGITGRVLPVDAGLIP